MKSHARVAVIGGGVTGCSVLYHLAKAGWSDAVLLERSELTSGSTWHAAGGTGALTGSANMSTLHKYSFELYPKIEAETGQSCGFHPVGRIALARTQARVEELRILRSKARRVGLEPVFLTNDEAMQMSPILDLSGVRAVLFDPAGGHVDPSGVTQAFAAGARLHGAEIVRQCPVIETNPRCDGSCERERHSNCGANRQRSRTVGPGGRSAGRRLPAADAGGTPLLRHREHSAAGGAGPRSALHR